MAILATGGGGGLNIPTATPYHCPNDATEGRALLRGRETPLPTRHESTNLSEEVGSLSEVSWRAPSKEESPIGWPLIPLGVVESNHQSHFLPKPMAESKMKDMVEGKCTLKQGRQTKEKGKLQRSRAEGKEIQGQLNISSLENTCPGRGARQTHNPPTFQGYYSQHQTISLDT